MSTGHNPPPSSGGRRSNDVSAIQHSEPLWNPDEVATFLNIPKKTLQKWRSEKTGPPWRRYGKHVRYEPRLVREWLSNQ
ncbi:helix-turn-helix domain-containing protein [Nocardia sp. NRRL S-836]|uniref:helix-turn-helix domain-containing protein n=1 Tax=Nocardia sp. NRRL S-836 TaxID=1519492 RepID=UPI00350F0A6A